MNGAEELLRRARAVCRAYSEVEAKLALMGGEDDPLRDLKRAVYRLGEFAWLDEQGGSREDVELALRSPV